MDVLEVLIWGFGGCWRFLTWVWHLDLDLDFGQWSFIHPCSKCWLSILILKVQRTSMSFESWFGALEDAGGSWLGFGSWYWFGYGHWCLIHLCLEFCLSVWILKVQRTSMSWFRAFEDAWGSWLGFCILILICIWSLVFDTTIFKKCSHLYSEGAKIIHVL